MGLGGQALDLFSMFSVPRQRGCCNHNRYNEYLGAHPKAKLRGCHLNDTTIVSRKRMICTLQ